MEGFPQKREVDPQNNMALGVILSLVLFVVACGVYNSIVINQLMKCLVSGHLPQKNVSGSCFVAITVNGMLIHISETATLRSQKSLDSPDISPLDTLK